MGSAACYHLARRGAAVAGLEQFEVPNDLGSSGGESRMIRQCYYEHPDYVPLLRRAYQLWRELSHEADSPILEITGGLFAGPADSPLVAGARAAAEVHSLEHEMLSSAALRRRFPQFAFDDQPIGLFEPGAGFVRPEMAIAAHARLAIRHGARLHTQERVLEWRADGRGVEVVTDVRTIRAESLIVCAGAWTSRVLPVMFPVLRVTRQVLAWVMPHDPAPFAIGSFPVWAVQHSGGDFHYGFPVIDPARGLKLGRHAPAAAVDPDRVARTTGPDDEMVVRPFLRRYLPAADGALREMSVCMYTNTPDAHFVIDRYPGYQRVWMACGFSGHGFKFAPVIGEALADLALSGATTLPIGFLGVSRFA